MENKGFNLVCLGLSAFFIFGTVWVWRDTSPQIYDPQIAQISQRSVVEMKENQFTASDNVMEEEENDDSGTVGQWDSSEKDQLEKNENADNDLPTEINLAVPFTSQAPEKNWDDPWQNACEEAAVLMLDAYYKGYGLSPLSAKDELLKMVEWEENLGIYKSMKMEHVQGLVDHYVLGKSKILNLKSKIIENPTVEQIKNYIASGTPVLVVAYGKDLPNPHFRNGGPEYHALIIRGYTEEKFITNDPGTQFGENFSYYYDELMNAIHDWNDGDVENGRRVVLVLE